MLWAQIKLSFLAEVYGLKSGKPKFMASGNNAIKIKGLIVKEFIEKFYINPRRKQKRDRRLEEAERKNVQEIVVCFVSMIDFYKAALPGLIFGL